jgi:threonylcarbamoyladenosine tRNA methylthiotransferase MtaB
MRNSGLDVVGAEHTAEAYIINTCTITTRADHKARACVRALAREHPDSLLIVTGCSAELEASSLRALSPNVVIVPQSRKERLLGLRELLCSGRDVEEQRRALLDAATAGRADPFALRGVGEGFRTRAFLKIQDGCNERCAYCRVPLARGAAVSLTHAEVIRRARQIESRGACEIVLTGVNLSAYASGNVRLVELLGILLASTTVARFRMSSLEPEALTPELTDALRHPRICPHFHFAVQSGSDAVLARMKRRYRVSKIRERIDLLRASRRDPFLAADFIVGFPAETDAEFEETLGIARDAAFAALHVFPFSPRPGTPAFSMSSRVPERVRSERAARLRLLSNELSRSYAEGWVGREVDVLFERMGRSGMLGTSGNYLRVETHSVPGGESAAGSRGSVLITSAGSPCQGRFLDFIHETKSNSGFRPLIEL